MSLIATASRLPSERLIALVGATLLIGTSAALGATYGYQLGSRQHAVLGVVFAAAALGGELLKPIAVAVGLRAAMAWQPLRALACLLVAAVCVIYSFAGELSIAAGARGDVAADRGAATEHIARARDRYEAARAELAALPQARPADELRMLISGVLAHPKSGGCFVVDGPYTRSECPKVAAWRAELARAERRIAVVDEMDRASTDVSGAPQLGAADPLAASLAAYVEAAGVNIAAERISPWLALIPVLFLEIGSALALVVVGCTEHRANEATTAVAETGAEERPNRHRVALLQLLKSLAANGGSLQLSTRALASSLSIGKGSVHRLLAEGAGKGLIRVSSTPRGSLIELAAVARLARTVPSQTCCRSL